MAKTMMSDHSGNLMVWGHFYESLDQEGYNGTFLHKYSPAGQLLWADTTKSFGIPVCGGMTMDNADNIYVTVGKTSNTNGDGHIWINGVKYPGGFGYMIKYNNAGQLMWVINTGRFRYPKDMTMDNSGNIFVTGSAGNFCFTQKFNTEGHLLEEMEICGNYISADRNGNIYLSQNGNIKKISSGTLIWSHNINSADFRISIDNGGNCYLVTCPTDYSSEMMKFSPSGELLWSHDMSFKAGGIFVSGEKISVVDETLSSKTASKLQVRQYNLNGDESWTYSIPNSGDMMGRGITEQAGAIYVSASGKRVLNNYVMRINMSGVATALGENNEDHDLFSVYPNPSRQFNINYVNNKNTPFSIRVHDITGKCILVKNYTNASGMLRESLDLSPYAKGVYSLQLVQEQSVQIRRLIVE
jgi:hypothetical protein